MLPTELTIGNVASLREEMLAAIAEPANGALAVDATQVQDVDSAGVQLLISLRRSLAARQRSLELVGVPPALQAALATLGVSLSAPLGDAR